MKLALFWQKMPKWALRCTLCNHFCYIQDGLIGACGIRQNKGGKLYSLNYGKIVAAHIDPIEKKPLYHFLPGTQSYSISTVGCNFRCLFCFHPQTKVTTNKGVLSIKEIFHLLETQKKSDSGKEEVVKLDNLEVITHRGKFKPIKKAFKHHYNGELLTIKPFYFPSISCTPSHEFWVTTQPYKEIKKIKAANLTLKNYFIVPKNFSCSGEVRIDVKDSLLPFVTEYRRSQKISYEDALKILQLTKNGMSSRKIGEIFKLHQTYVRKLRGKFKNIELVEHPFTFAPNELIEKDDLLKFKTEKLPFIPKIISLDKNFAKLLGYYCAEGWVGKSTDRPHSYFLSFSFGKKEKKYAGEVFDLVKKVFNLTPKIVKRKTTVTIEVMKTSVALLFKALAGSGALNKQVPEGIYKAKREVINTFLEAYVNGDGWKNKNGQIAVNTVSSKLALGIAYLVLKTGYLPKFYIWNPPKKRLLEGRFVNQSVLYYVKWQPQPKKNNCFSQKNVKFLEDKNYYYIPIAKISKKNYSGPVFNLEIKDDHSYLANFITVENCQNWDISQAPKPPQREIWGEDWTPKQVVEAAIQNNCPSIAYTYTEPTIFFEFALDCARLANKRGIKNIFVTNGYMSSQALKMISPYLDAANIDLKSFNPDFYRRISGGQLEPVLENIKLAQKLGIFIELTTLVIPGHNDSDKELTQIAQFIASLDSKIPWHISRFHPMYKMTDLPPTPTKTLKTAYEAGKKAGLKFVYVWAPPHGEEEFFEVGDTFCPRCGKLAIDRKAWQPTLVGVDQKGNCQACGESLNLII
jgi:pyruvate formate lyase activating enzyme